MVEKTENYQGPISIEFKGLPSVKLVSVIIDAGANWFERVAEATRRRFFTLDKDWAITLHGVDYLPALNGTIVIPRIVDGKTLVFDGASVPLPWLVSFLSMGILRPLGVMLTASIVHDFAFKHGYLLVAINATDPPKKIKIERHNTDRLFRDIISAANQVAIIGWVAWFFVRLGWLLGVRYNGKRYGGKPPVSVIAITSVSTLALGFYLFDGWQFQDQNFEKLITVTILSYIILYLATLITLGLRGSRVE